MRRSTNPKHTNEDGLEMRLVLAAPISTSFDAISTREGIAAWWTPMVRGRVTPGKTFELGFAGMDEIIRIHVEEAKRPNLIVWAIREHSGLPEWNGTRVSFTLSESGTNKTTLEFFHRGLHPQLGCYSDCHAGWEHFLKSLANVASGKRGLPFGA